VNLSDEDNPGNEISQIEAELEEFAEVSGELTSTGTIDQGHIVYCRASKSDCPRCLLKPKCTTAVARKIIRDLDDDVRDRTVHWPMRKPSSSRAANARRLRCDLRT
jgi:hypothetical protein